MSSSQQAKNLQRRTQLVNFGSHMDDDDIEFNNPIFDKHTAALRSNNEHDAMSDSMCIELDQSDSSEENLSLAGPQIVKQQWRPHTIPTASEGDKPTSNTTISLDPAVLSNGIYQGLAITDADKLNQGMIPESVFMTARLEEQEHIEMSRFRVSSHVPLISPFQPTLPPMSPTREQSQGAHTQSLDLTNGKSSPTLTLRTPPVPPALPNTASQEEQKRRHILEHLVTTEASLLNSLNIAVHVYMVPLREASDTPEPILDSQEINTLFGPVEGIISCHELFYLALSSKASEWAEGNTIGDCVLSSFSGNVAVKTYSEYVNNFTEAMSVLESRIKKRPRFVPFLKEALTKGSTNLSLQGLLLKPIQRFPQYILILQDFLKCTPSSHPDQMPLQMALTKLEGIAEHLNEAKREREQTTIVHYLNSRISGLPFKLIDSQRRLLRQDIVTRLLVKDHKVIRKKRTLLLFSNMVLCASVRYKNKKNAASFQEFPDAEGAKFQCKWYCTLDRLKVLEPDFSAFGSTNAFSASHDPEVQASFQKLKTEHDELESDFVLMSKMEVMTKSLKKNYQGLDAEMLNGYCKQLLKMIAKNESLIKQCEGGRLDISIPNREGGTIVKHVYAFSSQRVKDNWLRTLRFAGTKLASPNGLTWYLSLDQFEEEESVVVHDRRLPLYLCSHKISEVKDGYTIECGTYVGDNMMWLAAGNSQKTQVTIMEFSVPSGVNSVATFTVTAANRIICMACVDVDAANLVSRAKKTIWIGSENSQLILYNASSADREVLANIRLSDSVLSIMQIADYVCVGTADGMLVCFEQCEGGSGWDYENRQAFSIHSGPLSCMCEVEGKLWIGSENFCFIFNLSTKTVEKRLNVTVPGKQAHVRRILHVGAGVWVCLRQEMKLVLFHTTTHTILQEVNVKSNMINILKSAKLSKLDGEHAHISNILATKGLLWLGTSLGVTLVYRIPCLEGVPLISGRPYLAYDAHQNNVRILLRVTVTSRPVKKRIGSYILREHVRKMNRPISAFLEESLGSPSGHRSPTPNLSTSKMITDSVLENNGGGDSTVVINPLELSTTTDMDKLAQEVIGDLTSQIDKLEVPSRKTIHSYETVAFSETGKGGLLDLSESHEDTANSNSHSRRSSGEYEVVEYPQDGAVVSHINTPDLYRPMHPSDYTMSIPGKEDSMSGPPAEETQLVVTAGRGLTHFKKLKSRTVYHRQTTTSSSQQGHLIVYELDSNLRMFNSEGDD